MRLRDADSPLPCLVLELTDVAWVDVDAIVRAAKLHGATLPGGDLVLAFDESSGRAGATRFYSEARLRAHLNRVRRAA